MAKSTGVLDPCCGHSLSRCASWRITRTARTLIFGDFNSLPATRQARRTNKRRSYRRRTFRFDQNPRPNVAKVILSRKRIGCLIRSSARLFGSCAANERASLRKVTSNTILQFQSHRLVLRHCRKSRADKVTFNIERHKLPLAEGRQIEGHHAPHSAPTTDTMIYLEGFDLAPQMYHIAIYTARYVVREPMILYVKYAIHFTSCGRVGMRYMAVSEYGQRQSTTKTYYFTQPEALLGRKGHRRSVVGGLSGSCHARSL